MKVLYVAPRYHTNQIPIMKGWLSQKSEVLFLAQFASTPEDYTVLKPKVLGYNRAFDSLMKFFKWVLGRKRFTEAKEYAIRVKIGTPPIRNMKMEIKEFAPDVAILRERCFYNIPVYYYCKKLRIPCILYNQSPLWDAVDRDQGIGHRIMCSLLPKQRMTPVLGTQGKGKRITPNATYVPFVMDAVDNSAHYNKKIEGDKLCVLCVGTYEKRKNHFLLVNALEKWLRADRVQLRIMGEAKAPEEKLYFNQLKAHIQKKELSAYIQLEQNCDRIKVFDAYKQADLFVLPSTRERASISQLEAMSCGVPVICSDTNGSACYIEEGVNGFLFRDGDEESLREKLELALASDEELKKMGEASYRLVRERYQFEDYYQKILEIMEKG